MKQLCFFLLHIFLSYFCIAQYTWEKVPFSVPGNINDMVFTHADTGFLALTSETDGGVILKTTDGGITWNENELIAETEIAHILKIQMLNGTTGFAFGSSVGYKAILKTEDAGLTWQATEIPVTDNVYDMHFLSSEAGYLAFYQPDIFKYTGEEETSAWLNLMYMGTPIMKGCNSVYATHTDTMFLLYNDGYTRTSIFRVDNETDLYDSTGIPPEVSYSAFFSEIAFTDSRKGFIIGEDRPDENPVRKGIILKTIDGGSDFELCNTPHLLAEKNAGLLQIDMLNNSIGAVLGNYYGTTIDTSLILTTQDGGKTWYESDLHVPLRAEAISQPDENTFYIAGDTAAYGGMLYKFTQKPQNLPVIELSGIEISLFPNPNDGILHLKISSIRPADYQFIMMNTISQIVYEEQFFRTKSIQKEIHHYQPPGYYLGTVFSDNKMVKTFPIIVH